MPRHRQTRSPLILYGEGPTEGLFLGLIKQLYSKQLCDKQITVAAGTGGSSGSILLELKKKYLDTGKGHQPALVLLDEDNGLDAAAKKILSENQNIQVLLSTPQCLEGLLLDLLDDLPPKAQQTSEQLKKRFQDTHLGSDRQVQKNFKLKRIELFPKSLLDAKANTLPAIQSIFQFLGLPT